MVVKSGLDKSLCFSDIYFFTVVFLTYNCIYYDIWLAIPFFTIYPNPLAFSNKFLVDLPYFTIYLNPVASSNKLLVDIPFFNIYLNPFAFCNKLLVDVQFFPLLFKYIRETAHVMIWDNGRKTLFVLELFFAAKERHFGIYTLSIPPKILESKMKLRWVY